MEICYVNRTWHPRSTVSPIQASVIQQLKQKFPSNKFHQSRSGLFFKKTEDENVAYSRNGPARFVFKCQQPMINRCRLNNPYLVRVCCNSSHPRFHHAASKVVESKSSFRRHRRAGQVAACVQSAIEEGVYLRWQGRTAFHRRFVALSSPPATSTHAMLTAVWCVCAPCQTFPNGLSDVQYASTHQAAFAAKAWQHQM